MLRIGVNADQVTDVYIVGELSPSEAEKWLQDMGVGTKLSQLLINVYGGHIQSIASLLQRLPDYIKDPLDDITVSSQGLTAVSRAISSWVSAGH